MRLRTLVLFLIVTYFSGLLEVTLVAQIELNTTTATLRAKAAPDECFFGIGSNVPFLKPPCIPFISRPKVNQGYVWGAARAGNDVWFGTVANPQCVTQGGLFPPETLLPYETESWACEFAESPYVKAGLLPGPIGDFRPPQVFVFNRVTQQLIEVTPKAPVGPTNPLGLADIVYTTRGFRSAAVIGNLVLIGGPSLLGGLNFLAYRADTREYLGSGTVPGYDNIRQMLVHNNQLYIPVGTNLSGGKVLRWTGALSGNPCVSCFQFQVVGNLDSIGAYVAVHENRLFVTTWPTGQQKSVSSLFMSPPLTVNGLGPGDASLWKKVWNATQYEPDRTIAASYAGGALASFDGYLYWGTMHVPWFATIVHIGENGAPSTQQGWIDATVGTFRTATLFRGTGFAEVTPNIQLLYGLPSLPKYVPPAQGGGVGGRWELAENNLPAGKKTPMYGPPGFGNWYNNYTWQMAVWDNRLWVGTMDWGHTAEQGTKVIFKQRGQTYPIELASYFALQPFGADLYFFQSSASPAVAEDVGGIGNFSSYGIRDLLPGDTMFVGMANPSNLLTGFVGPKGGWELLELRKKPGSTPLNLLTAFTCSPSILTGPGTAQCTATLARPSAGTSIPVGLFPISFDASVTIPPNIFIPPGLTTAFFPVHIGESGKPTTLYLIANVNGGTMVSAIKVEPGVPRISGVVTAKGKLPTGQIYLDLQFTNTGTGTARSATLTQLLPRALTGTGTITYATGPGLSPSLPVNLGTIAPGGIATRRVMLNVPPTVTRFNLTENGNVSNLAGTSYSFSISQSIIP